METPPKRSFAQNTSLKQYGVDRWGEKFLQVGPTGNLVFEAPGLAPVDLQRVAEVLDARGVRTPFVLRFPTMIEGQIQQLSEAFARAYELNAVPGSHQGVFPLKVNQRRSVVDTVVGLRQKYGYGLEAGSKPELLLAMAKPVVAGTVLLVNGFKDREFIRMAFHAAELGHHVVVVLESIREVVRYLDVAAEAEWKRMPDIGLRAKLYARGSGRWTSSGGETSKFGLTTGEILQVVRHLEEAELIGQMALLHFHIGSQITRIARIKQAVREGTRLYCELQRYCPNLRYLDLGGGIGVDYDGSRTSYPSSANYSLEEYASQVVFEAGEVIAAAAVRPPILITESGRVVVAKHAVTVTDLREVQGNAVPVPELREGEHRLIASLRETLEQIGAKNYEEYFHDALDFRDEALDLFSRGYLSLEDRAAAEALFHQVRAKTGRIVAQLSRPSEEIEEYLQGAQHKYLANISVFQSLPDSWSIDHVFPVAPLSRHGERPGLKSRIVDITCDSLGCVDRFAHPEDNLKVLPLHAPNESGDKYYLGFFMTGAYQDSLASAHNLFSRCHEVVVRREDDEPVLQSSEIIDFADGIYLEVKIGETNEDALSGMDHDVESMLRDVRKRHLTAETTLGQAWFLGLLQSYPYLQR